MGFLLPTVVDCLWYLDIVTTKMTVLDCEDGQDDYLPVFMRMPIVHYSWFKLKETNSFQ